MTIKHQDPGSRSHTPVHEPSDTSGLVRVVNSADVVMNLTPTKAAAFGLKPVTTMTDRTI